MIHHTERAYKKKISAGHKKVRLRSEEILSITNWRKWPIPYFEKAGSPIAQKRQTEYRIYVTRKVFTIKRMWKINRDVNPRKEAEEEK